MSLQNIVDNIMSNNSNIKYNELLHCAKKFEKVLLKYPITKQPEILEYIYQLDDINQVACLIAFDQLETSFNILRSNGYIEWLKHKK